MKGVQFNWARSLYSEFIMKCQEAEDHSNTFHYAWLMFSIVLVASELPEDREFPPIALELLEVAKFTSLWATKDP